MQKHFANRLPPGANRQGDRHAAEFKGFGDWVEVFAAGTHTDAKGKTRTWTEADLDQMVSNFSAKNPFPLVIGHPKTDSPAFGWGSAVKRAGQKLLAQFRQVPEAVEKAAESGAYRNRSAKIAKTDAGFKLVHVGLLGAAPPAIEGLEAVYSAADEGEEYEFANYSEELAKASLTNLPWMMRSIARTLRTFREYVIGKEGVEAADKAMPGYHLDELDRAASDAEAQARVANQLASGESPFNASETEDASMPFSQADLDAAVKKAREEEAAKLKALQDQVSASQFAGRLAENKAFVSSLISDKDGNVRLTPAQAEGWAEALTFAQGLDAAEFTFSAAEGGEQKPQLFEFLKGKLQALAPVLKLGAERAGPGSAPLQGSGYEFSAPADTSVDPSQAALYSRAKQYQAQHPNTPWLEAVSAVSQ